MGQTRRLFTTFNQLAVNHPAPALTHSHKTHLSGTEMGLWRPLEARRGCEEGDVQVASEIKTTMYADDVVKPDDSYDKQAAQ